jgi:hypothetical protein
MCFAYFYGSILLRALKSEIIVLPHSQSPPTLHVPATPTAISPPSPPPAKRTRKAAKRRCELELLRDDVGGFNLALSPTPSTPPSPLPLLTSPSVPSPLLSPGRSSSLPPLRRYSVSTPLTTAILYETPTHFSSAPCPTEPSSPATPSSVSSPASPALTSLTPPTSPEASLPLCSPPTPPPWSRALSTDPDRVVCPSCCKESYNFRWYDHCFMYHMAETRK